MNPILSRPPRRRAPVVVRPRTLLRSLALAVVLTGAGLAPVARAASGAGIAILSPSPNQTVSDAVAVRVHVTGIRLDEGRLGVPGLSGIGHWHLYVDGVYAGLSVTATLVVPNPTLPRLTTGDHLFTVVLHTNDHHPLANASVAVRATTEVDFRPEPLAASGVATQAADGPA